MKYYQMHERVYQDLKSKGFLSWDKHPEQDQFLNTGMNTSLKKLIPLANLKVLDLGCGAGNCALFCAINGCEVTGVDASATALEMARKNAIALETKAEFIHADVLSLDLNQNFDLITDSSLLHCLVGQTDRSRFYEIVKKHLNPNGRLYIHTMIMSPDISKMVDPAYFLMEDEILWSLGIQEIEEGRKVFNGKSYFPHRSILKEPSLLKEFKLAGFEVITHEIDSTEGQPHTYKALLKTLTAC